MQQGILNGGYAAAVLLAAGSKKACVARCNTLWDAARDVNPLLLAAFPVNSTTGADGSPSRNSRVTSRNSGKVAGRDENSVLLMSWQFSFMAPCVADGTICLGP